MFFFHRIILFLVIFSILNSICTGLKKFGCDFEDVNYSYKLSNIYEAKFGDSVSPMTITLSHLQEIIRDLESNIVEVISQNLVNNMDDFLTFYNAFNNTGDFDTFFNNYRPPNRPKEYAHSFTIEVFDKTVIKYPKIENHIYLVTASLAMPENYITLVKEYKNVPDYFVHSHVAGVLKFKIDGEREGYLLVDPGLGAEQVAVIMKDKQSPHKMSIIGTLRDPTGETYDFALDKNNYVIAMTYSEDNLDTGIAHERHIYYFDQAFCSFLETTVKLFLLTPDKGIVKRDLHGYIVGSFYVTINSKNSKVSICYLDNSEIKSIYMSVKNFLLEFEAHKSLITGFETAMGWKTDTVKEKVTIIQNILEQGQTFITQITKENLAIDKKISKDFDDAYKIYKENPRSFSALITASSSSSEKTSSHRNVEKPKRFVDRFSSVVIGRNFLRALQTDTCHCYSCLTNPNAPNF